MMKPLSDRIIEARDIAVAREGDIRIQEYLSAMKVGNRQPIPTDTRWASVREHASVVGSRNGPAEPERLELSVDCHFRSWHKSIQAEMAAQLELMTPEGLARTIAGWVQEAIKEELLLLSNPPRDRAIDPTEHIVGRIYTCMYDPNGNLVGTRWGGS
jgi:hypothetical protein